MIDELHKKINMKLLRPFSLLALSFSLGALSMPAFAKLDVNFPNDCGRVIAHENGYLDKQLSPLNYCHGINTCPAQLKQMQTYNSTQSDLNKQLRFAKISIRTLKDGTWVVAHDDQQYISPLISASATAAKAMSDATQTITLKLPSIPNTLTTAGLAIYQQPAHHPLSPEKLANLFGNAFVQTNDLVAVYIDKDTAEKSLDNAALKLIEFLPTTEEKASTLWYQNTLSISKVTLSQIDSGQYNALKAQYGDRFPVYRFNDYAAVVNPVNPTICLMLYFKSDINQNIFNDVHASQSQDKVIFESRNNSDARQIQQQFPGFFYTGRASNQDDLNDILNNLVYLPDMKMVEISGGDKSNIEQIANLVLQVRGVGLPTEVDAMRFSTTGQELLKSGCEIPLKNIGSNTSMTSRPIDCIENRL